MRFFCDSLDPKFITLHLTIAFTRRLNSQPSRSHLLNRVQNFFLSSKYKKKNANWKSINQLNRIFLFADFIVIRWHKLRVTKGLSIFNEPISIQIIFEFHFNKRWKREWKSRRELLFAELLLFFFHRGRAKKNSSTQKNVCEWNFGALTIAGNLHRMGEDANNKVKRGM